MGKRKGQTHDYRVEFALPHHGPHECSRRVRGDRIEALLLARRIARRDGTRYAALIHVDPATRERQELVRYTPDEPPPDTDEDLITDLINLTD